MAKPDISKFKVVMFDLFHTLSSLLHSDAPGKNTHDLLEITREEWVDALFNKTGDRLRGKIKDHKMIIRDIVDKLGHDIPDDVIENTARIRHDRFKHSLKNISERTVITVRELKNMGKKIILVSNADDMESAGWIDSPLAEHFDHVVFSCDVGFIKPERDIFDHAVKLSGVDISECLFVGDGGSDELIGAKNAGLKTVFTSEFIKDLWPEHIEERKKIADYHIESIDQLLPDKKLS